MGRTSGTRPKGSGPGWGGEAKGAGGGPAQPFSADSPTRETIPGGVGDPAKKLTREEKAAAAELRAERAWGKMDDMVANPQHPSHYLAVRETLNRIDGMPVANVNLKANVQRSIQDLSDEEILALLGGAPVEPGSSGGTEAAGGGAG